MYAHHCVVGASVFQYLPTFQTCLSFSIYRHFNLSENWGSDCVYLHSLISHLLTSHICVCVVTVRVCAQPDFVLCALEKKTKKDNTAPWIKTVMRRVNMLYLNFYKIVICMGENKNFNLFIQLYISSLFLCVWIVESFCF